MSILTNTEIIKNHLISAYSAAKMIEMETQILERAIARVRELHSQNDIYCNSCGDDRGGYALYPCDTIKALDGEQ